MPESLGRYKLLKRIAVGGMAEIWLARQEGLQGFEKLLVVKKILPHLAEHPQFVQMFLDEARLAAQLTHPNIVQIFDLGEEQGSYFIAMEHIHGENLRVVARRRARAADGCVPALLAAHLMAQACGALHYAHTRKDGNGQPLNIVHRDISPQNIILGYDGVAKVVDFGIAKASSQFNETQTGVLKGKYAYMSPEQTLGEPLDGRSDVFALGVVLWELVTGQRLFSRNSDLMILKAISEETAPAPTTLYSELPSALDNIIMKALEKRPADRYQSAGEMQEALELMVHESGERVGAKQLTAFMQQLFPDRLEAWQEVLSSARAPKLDLESAAFEERSDLIEMATPSASKRAPAPGGPPAALREGSELLGEATQMKSPARVQAAAAAVGAAAAAREASGDGVEGPGAARTPSAAPSRALFFAGGGLGLAVVLGGLFMILRGSGAASEADRAAAVATDRTHRAPVRLRIRTSPSGATVTVKGIPLARRSPIDTELEATGEEVEVRLMLAGYEPELRKATLSAGKQLAWEVNFKMHQEAAPTPEIVVAAPKPAAAPKPGPKPKAKARRKGSLSFDARPWCRLSIDGKEQGVTPFVRLPLAAGKHRLRCVHPSLGTRSFSLRIRAGQQLKRVLTLGSGTLKLLVKPWATVILDGKARGETPLPPISLAAGEHTLLLVNKELGVRRKKTLQLRPGQTLSLHEDLRSKP